MGLTAGPLLLLQLLAATVPGNPLPALQRVANIQGVKSIKELKDLKAVKSVTRIDDDLALKMRDLIENQKTERGSEQSAITNTVQPEIQEPDLENKVKRILEMFNVKNLDEILNAIPITSIKKLPTREPDSEDVKEGPPGVTTVEEENRAVERLALQIRATTDQHLLLSAARQKETDFQVTLARMLELEKDKITKIESLIQSHARRAESIEAELTLLESMLAGAKQQQINHLENLKRLVEQKRTEAVSRLAATLPLVGARIAQLGDSSAAALPLVGARTAQLGDSGQWIDSSLYHAVPVSKIKSIQNLKNIVEITAEQARTLQQWQEERNGRETNK